MPDFTYRMANADGSIAEGAMSAPDEVQLAQQVGRLGGVLVSYKVKNEVRTDKARMARRELITFTQHMLTAVQSGIPVLTAVRGYAEQAEDPAVRETLNTLSMMVEGGQSLSESMGQYPNIFPTLYVNMVAAGEVSGQLDNILARLVDYLEWMDEMTRDLKQATIYPAAVMTLVAGLIVFLLSFVLPRFMGIFDGAEDHLPLAAKILMGAGSLFGNNWPILFGAIATVVVAYKLAKRNEKGADWLAAQQLKLPLFGINIRYICLSQMTYALGLLIGAGVNITTALALATKAVTNRHLAKVMHHVGERVNAGETLTEALTHSNQFPALALQMIAVGEESGSLAEALDRCTSYLRREVQHGLKTAMKILEPAITLFLGIVVGGIALTIFYTMYTMIMAIGGGAH